MTLDPLYTNTAVSFIDGAEDQFIARPGAERGGYRLSVSAHLLARQYISEHGKAGSTCWQ